MTTTSRSSETRASALRQVVIVSGLSGAGKSQALKVLEDLGYYCTDNLPLPLLESFLEFCTSAADEQHGWIGIGMDVRSRSPIESYPAALMQLRSLGYPLEVLFLDADDRTLFTRFRETRRPHPLEGGGDILGIIARERQALAPLREVADWVQDTSSLSIHQLRRHLTRRYRPTREERLQVTLMSFGFRYGVPFDSDLVFDVRFLPNPHFDDTLRPHDGREALIQEFVFSHEVSRGFLDKMIDFLGFLLPQYQQEGKTYLTISIGCTGGRHRSVAMVESLRGALESLGFPVDIRHRDLSAQRS